MAEPINLAEVPDELVQDVINGWSLLMAAYAREKRQGVPQETAARHALAVGLRYRDAEVERLEAALVDVQGRLADSGGQP